MKRFSMKRCKMKRVTTGNIPMNHPNSGHPVLERLLAQVLQYGTWLASATIAVGLVLALMVSRPDARSAGFLSSTRVVETGIILFILLPVFRVFLMLLVFLKERDYRFSAIAGLVLLILALGFIVGMRVSAGAG
jgi:uncharacterized membrane protein